jgi:hypothetical protein
LLYTCGRARGVFVQFWFCLFLFGKKKPQPPTTKTTNGNRP